MRLLPAVLIAVVSNLDNLGVGVALGIRGTKVPPIPNLIIAAMTMAGTAAAMTSGRALSRLIDPSTAASLGAVIIIAVGALSLLAALFAGRAPSHAPRVLESESLRRRGNGGKTISYREALELGVALSLNNIGSGVGAGIAGIPPLATTALAGAFSLLSIGGGSWAGRPLRGLLLGDRAPLASGVALMAVGIAMLSGVL
ncbi:MAG: manganese efflux pump [Solirubrobacterales bacterium]|nr:manganese efflux pump [Solirubrobacterales bacterium]